MLIDNNNGSLRFESFKGEKLKNNELGRVLVGGEYRPDVIAKKIFDVIAKVNGNYEEDDYRSSVLDETLISVSTEPIISWRGTDENATPHDSYYTIIIVLEISEGMKKPKAEDFAGVYLDNDYTTHSFGIKDTFVGYELTKIW